MTVKELISDIKDMYDRCSVGGPLHIVLDDGNIEDRFIQYCLDSCREHWSVTEDPDNSEGMIQLTECIGKALLEMSEDERQELYELNWGRRS